MNRAVKPKFWRGLFLLLSFAYLFPEAIFNSQLVSLVGLGTPDDQELEQLEVFGRSISGIGATLLIADLLPVKFYQSICRGALTLVSVGIVVWPSVYFGQKILIERLLIEPSTAQQREYAVLSAAFRDALAINAVEVAGLEYDAKTIESSENLTFLALFGGLLYADDQLAENLDSHKRLIIKQFVQKRAYRDFDKYYEDFSHLYERLSKSYNEYAHGSNQYNQSLVEIPHREQEYWQKIEQKVNEGWIKYQQTFKSYIARAEVRAQEYGPQIYQYFERTEHCKERYSKASNRAMLAQCIEELNAKYKVEIDKAGLGYIHPDYWLIVEEVSGLENATNTVLAGVLTGGYSTAMQALSILTGGDGGIKDKRYKYTSDPTHYQRLFLAHPNFQAQFTKDVGYPMGIEDLSAFRVHESTQYRLREYLLAEGLILSNEWNIDQRQEFADAVANKVKQEADAKWSEAMNRKGLSLPVNLQWHDFQLHKSVQKIIESDMGDMYVQNIQADWSQANFKRYVLDPNIEKRTQKYLDMISGARPHFEDGGKYSEAGKQALRSVIIPPISMSLSLFLICLTLVKLPIKIIELTKPNWSESLPKWGVTVIKTAPILLLVGLPIFVFQSQYTANPNSPVNYFLTKVEDASNPLFSFSLRWTLHVQPILHPLGLKIESHTGIYKKAEPYTHKFASMDAKLPGWLMEKPRKAKHNSNKNLNSRLTVQVDVDNAVISIMNIKPKYREKMELQPGLYDIQVSAKGYRTYRKWHTVSPGDQLIKVELAAN